MPGLTLRARFSASRGSLSFPPFYRFAARRPSPIFWRQNSMVKTRGNPLWRACLSARVPTLRCQMELGSEFSVGKERTLRRITRGGSFEPCDGSSDQVGRRCTWASIRWRRFAERSAPRVVSSRTGRGVAALLAHLPAAHSWRSQ